MNRIRHMYATCSYLYQALHAHRMDAASAGALVCSTLSPKNWLPEHVMMIEYTEDRSGFGNDLYFFSRPCLLFLEVIILSADMLISWNRSPHHMHGRAAWPWVQYPICMDLHPPPFNLQIYLVAVAVISMELNTELSKLFRSKSISKRKHGCASCLNTNKAKGVAG